MVTLEPGETKIISQVSPKLENVHLWSNSDPYLYKLASVLKRGGTTTDEVTTPYGIRTISWPVLRNDGDPTFRLNGNSLFLNGTAEMKHRFGQSHAFFKRGDQGRVKHDERCRF